MARKIKASIILPTYNEAGFIIELIEDLRHQLKMKKVNFEIIVVDDDSQDKTGLLARKYFTKSPNVRVIIRKKERGLATAIRRGIESAVGDVIVVMDTDYNHEPRVVPRLIDKCKKYDIVIGSRFVRGGGMADKRREFLSRLYNKLLIQPLLNSPVKDNLSGFFAMKQEKLDDLEFDNIFYGYGDYFIRLIYYANINGNRFTEAPSFYVDRAYGISKSNFIDMFQGYMMSAFKLRFRND